MDSYFVVYLFGGFALLVIVSSIIERMKFGNRTDRNFDAFFLGIILAAIVLLCLFGGSK